VRRRCFLPLTRVCLKDLFRIKVRELPCASHQKRPCLTSLYLAPWLESTRALVSKLRSHLDGLADLQIQFSQAGDTDGCLSLKCCVAIILTHLARNYNLLGKHSTNAGAVDDRTSCADMISHLAAVTQGLRVEASMRRVHMYTGVCFSNLPSSSVPGFLISYVYTDVLDEGAEYVSTGGVGIDCETRNQRCGWLRPYGSTRLQRKGVFARTHCVVDTGVSVVQWALLLVVCWQLIRGCFEVDTYVQSILLSIYFPKSVVFQATVMNTGNGGCLPRRVWFLSGVY
jgi:hypothetical protein